MHLHRWVVVEKVEQPSAWEQMTTDARMENFKTNGRWAFERRMVVHYRCSKCGAERVVVV